MHRQAGLAVQGSGFRRILDEGFRLTALTLYSRSYCHLCDDLLHALQEKFSDVYTFDVTVIDVDADPLLLAQYDELVPVLVAHKDGVATELCHYFLDEAAVDLYLKAQQTA